MQPRLGVVTESFADRPAYDTAISAALLRRVAAGDLEDTIRIYRPGNSVAFGRRDVRSPGYEAAWRAAANRGFAPIERLAGGRAAVFHHDTIAIGWAQRLQEPRSGIDSRFRHIANLIARSLRMLGIDSRIGEVPGEYCPGRYSVNSGGTLKLAGTGQRIVSGAAHVGGVIVTSDSEAIKMVLTPVYRELGLDWRPSTTGATEEISATAGWNAVFDRFTAELKEEFELFPATLDSETVELAHSLVARHQPADYSPSE